MEAQEVKAANASLRICFTMCYTIWARQWDKKKGRPNDVKNDFALITRNWQFVKSFMNDASGNRVWFYSLTYIL